MPSGSDRFETTREQPRHWIASCLGWTAADRRNQVRFLVWLFVWAVSFVVAALALRGRFGPALEGPVVWVVAMVPTVLSLVALAAYLRFLRMADELTRQVQLEGLALGFGVGVVFCMAYHLLELAGAPRLELAEVGTVLFIAMGAGQLRAAWRYR